jgi:hypothetical protein
MATIEIATEGLHGMYRDVLRDAAGRVIWDRGWQPNVVVDSCRSLLASLVDGQSVPVSEITGLRVGFGLASWDAAGTPGPLPTTAQLVDPRSHLVARAGLALTFIDATGNPTASPTNRLQIFASLGPGIPPWPEPPGTLPLPPPPYHPAPTLREFGLVASLNGAEVLLNYRTHPAIAKDPVSTLERTIWLVF